MSVLYLPVCPTDCSGAVAPVAFDDCVPELHWGEVSEIYIVGFDPDFVPFTEGNITSLAEWLLRMDQEDDDMIRMLTVIGEFTEAEITEVPYSGDRIAIGFKTFNLPFEIDETSQTNYEFLLNLECGGHFRIWFETSDGVRYGGLEGIEASVRLNLVIPRERTALVKFIGNITWKSLYSPFRNVTPF